VGLQHAPLAHRLAPHQQLEPKIVHERLTMYAANVTNGLLRAQKIIIVLSFKWDALQNEYDPY